jgi:hypothetical protein
VLTVLSEDSLRMCLSPCTKYSKLLLGVFECSVCSVVMHMFPFINVKGHYSFES